MDVKSKAEFIAILSYLKDSFKEERAKLHKEQTNFDMKIIVKKLTIRQKINELMVLIDNL